MAFSPEHCGAWAGNRNRMVSTLGLSATLRRRTNSTGPRSTKVDSQPTKITTEDTHLSFGLTINDDTVREQPEAQRFELDRQVRKGSYRDAQNPVDQLIELVGCL